MAAMTVLVVDDHSGFRSCARRLLEREGYDVVAEAGDGASAVACARELRPQLKDELSKEALQELI